MKNIYIKNSLILILILILLLKTDLCNPNIVEDLKDVVLNAENIFGNAASRLGQFASQLKSVKNTWEDTVEEDCVYTCSNGKKPVPNKYYKPHSNGCGVNGIEIKLDNIPFKEMTKCCDVHDVCYGTCGNNRDVCDLQFKRCLYKICDDQLGQLSEPLRCKSAAKMLYTGTNVLGCKFFKDAQREACYCSSEKKKYRGDEL